ncbi:MAG: hypothetical protein J6D36_01890 [Erysipelotrichaceae bacterium]|nr:hypothetical protein [Erysipelotrichaceae bacterium]
MRQQTDFKKLKQALARIMSDGLTHQKSQLIRELGHMTPRKDKERVIRKTVELINQDDEYYPDVLIIGTSDRSGYRLGTNIDY